MIVDMHCHLDRYPDPRKIAAEAERAGVSIIAITNLAEQFSARKQPAAMLKNVRLSLDCTHCWRPHSERDLRKILDAGPFLSINSAMLIRKGRAQC